ncbi:unnamed protein product [Urochloa decumbens]|uniref:Knottin scorpion toxin-like domain-containing protein n=1 Tax=Urochloa decumbens TaxID=240449 RepID=A0ABC9H3Y0_9POAL
MEPSRKNPSATTAAVVLLLIVMISGPAPVEALFGYCSHFSANYHGWCNNRNNSCTNTCLAESPDNVDGYCGVALWTSACYCVTKC